eukprot:4542903-Prymnesium_polylepis.1
MRAAAPPRLSQLLSGEGNRAQEAQAEAQATAEATAEATAGVRGREGARGPTFLPSCSHARS